MCTWGKGTENRDKKMSRETGDEIKKPIKENLLSVCRIEETEWWSTLREVYCKSKCVKFESLIEEFNYLLIQSGISRQLAVPKTPEQNDVAEKMNPTLFNMARCLFLEFAFRMHYGQMWKNPYTMFM
ncbi:hypothetical protein CEXT_705101 [Caerostris extrusa]|uniref:Integrase catalytic domain-containing protein n=1 Tax=Caerostris extrusa TaxID=172846 RepID=A0AAV4NVN0_CAEEX|nr:hypothetical protein CEXT_705101 [Caerostris extrusa]